MIENIFQKIPPAFDAEISSVLIEKEGVKIERIVSDGQESPEGFWYDQKQDEWILLLSGSAIISVEKDTGKEQVELHAGDYLLIPAHQRHRVEATSLTEKTIWLAVFH